MRVAYVCMDSGVPVYGAKGCSVHVQEVVRAFVRRGATVDLFAARVGGEPVEDFRSPAIRLHHVRRSEAGDTAEREQAALAANRQLGMALQRQGPFDLVYERYSLWSFAGMQYAAAHGVAGVLEVNAPLIEEQARDRALVDRPAAELAAHEAFAAAHALLAVSRPVAAYLEGFEGTQGKIHVVPNGVDPRRVHPQVAPRRPPERGTFVVGFVGTLKRWHGLQTLVAAFDVLRRSAPEARLLIVGSGPEERALVADLTNRDLLGDTHLTGTVAPSEIPALLTSMHAAVAPAPAIQDFYFSPLKIFEYMAAGLPVVASGIGQIAEIIQDGQTGLLCGPDDAQALASALDRLRRDPVLRSTIGTAGRATVLESHTWDHTVDRILQIAGSACVSREARV